MGASALSHLARRGVSAVGIERYERLHDKGASSGESRIIRKAYFENSAYVPLLERAYRLWDELEARSGRALIDMSGLLMVGAADSRGIAGALESARRFDLRLATFDAAQIERRFPGTRPRPDEVGLLERDAGIVTPEEAVAAFLDDAERHGATTIFEQRVETWDRRDGSHHLTLASGESVEAARLVICPGMWAQQLLGELKLPLRIQRNVQLWFEPSTSQFDRGVFPTFFVERVELPAPLYGFPAMGGTIKAALHGHGDIVDPERPERRIRDSDVTVVRDALDEWIPGAASSYSRGRVCMYTRTPDDNFIIDLHPTDPTVAIACGFSGHGFKFCPVVGEILTSLVLDGGTEYDVGFLGIERFSARA
ncbi:MAG: N-methyl-L-tryptophan oxidase [Candidatus Eremiobacteraeota bacterium]|nr:N-methyl-L-tryptophan oxidase [Candidatus Eremiobacteraeota bacterium]